MPAPFLMAWSTEPNLNFSQSLCGNGALPPPKLSRSSGHLGVKQRQPLLCSTEPSAHSSKKNNPQTRIIFIWMCLQALCYFFFLFFWQNYKGSNRKKCINYFPIQLLWKQWLAWSCTIFHIGMLLKFMEKGSGYPQLFRNLSLCKQSLSPPKSPPAAHVHIKTVDRIPPGNFFHQHSFHGDREVVLRDSSYTLRWQSWTFTNFKELHRVFQLETKAPPKK